MWNDLSGNEHEIKEIAKLIHELTHVMVGTDSQLVGGSWNIATAICLYTPGKGGRVFYKREKKERSTYQNLDGRLLDEVYRSVTAADEIKNLCPNAKINIHADIASDPGCSSNKAAKSALSFISGMGFSAIIKPDSWAASSVADKIAK